MQKNILFIFGLFLLFTSCAGTRNNGIGTGDVGNATADAIASTGRIEGGIDSVNGIADAVEQELRDGIAAFEGGRKLDANAMYAMYAMYAIGAAQSAVIEAIRLNKEVSDFIKRIRERENQKRSGARNAHPCIDYSCCYFVGDSATCNCICGD